MDIYPLFVTAAVLTPVKSRVEGIEILAIQLILGDAQGFAKPLEMHHLPHAQEFDGFAHIRLLDQTQDIVIGGAGLLLSSQVFCQVCDRISCHLELGSRERETTCR